MKPARRRVSCNAAVAVAGALALPSGSVAWVATPPLPALPQRRPSAARPLSSPALRAVNMGRAPPSLDGVDDRAPMERVLDSLKDSTDFKSKGGNGGAGG